MRATPDQPRRPPAAAALDSVHQFDGKLDAGSLSEEIEEDFDPSAVRAGTLDHRDEACERPAPDLHPITGTEAGERADDAPLTRAGGDQADRALGDGGRDRAEGNEVPDPGGPDYAVVLLGEGDANEEIAGEERRNLVPAVLEDAGKEGRHTAALELLHRVVFFAGLGPDDEPLRVPTTRL